MNRKLGYAAMASAFAFLFATNPVVAEAARQLTGADIKDNSIASIDVKDGNLKTKDLSPATIENLSPDTAEEVLGKLTGVDGAGSQVDADTLDGLSSEAFLPSRTYKIVGPYTQGEVDNRTGGRSAELSCDQGDLLINGGFYTATVNNRNQIQGLNNYYGNTFEMEWWVPEGAGLGSYGLVVSCLDTASPAHTVARQGQQRPAR